MKHEEEMYETIDEYLESAIKVMKEMYDEYGSVIFSELQDDYDIFCDFRDKVYEITEVISDEDLKGFKDMYIKKFNEAFNHGVAIFVNAIQDEYGYLEFKIHIVGTVIHLHKRGRNVKYGENTPVEIKTIIRDVVM